MACPSQLEETPIVIDDTDENDEDDDLIILQPGEDKTIKEMVHEILQRDKYTHQFLWKQKIDSMKEFQLKTILDLLSIESKNKFDESIYIEVLKVLLINWDGLSAYDCELENPSEIVYNELLAYLSKNIITLRRIVLTKLIRNEKVELYETEFDESEFDECIVIECPLKKLKTLFCSKFDIKKGMIYDLTYNDMYKSDFNYFPQSFTNWPHTAVKFSIKGFEVLHQNYNHYEYNVIDLNSKSYKPMVEEEANTAVHFLPNECDKYVHSPSIVQFICGLRTKISHRSCELLPAKKVEMITFLNEIARDFRLTSDNVGLGVSYFMNLSPFPYVLCTSNTIVPNRKECKHKNEMSIRLQQIVYPAVQFCVSKFPSTTADDQFLTLEELKNSLKYYCTLCKRRFETTNFHKFTQHAITVHGFENGHYCCVRCDKYFPIKILSGNRWAHTCVPKLDVIRCAKD